MEVSQAAANSNYYLAEQKQREPMKTLDKDAFLQIMIAQLKNQDPTSPMDSAQFVNQMAMFTTLEQMTNLNSNFEKLYALQQFSSASALLDCEVTLQTGEEPLTGIIQRVTMDAKGVKVWVNDQAYELSQVTAVEGRAPNGSEELLEALTDTFQQQASDTFNETTTDGETGEEPTEP